MIDARFAGFRAGELATAVPNVFFTSLLPAIDDPAELAVTCYCFFALARVKGQPRALALPDLEAEPPLMRALAGFAEAPRAALERGLGLAMARGTLLEARRREADGGGPVYLLNTEQNRRLLTESAVLALAPRADLAPALPRPNIYTLYEENIGSMAPLLVDALREAEELYPAAWIEAAFREAVARNRRSWRYISRILERWKTDGPTDEALGGPVAFGAGGRRRSLSGTYRHLVKRAPDAG